MKIEANVVIPMYNSVSSIEKSVRSVLDQKNIFVKVFVVDHGSDDGSLELVTQKFRNDERVKIVSIGRSKNEKRSASKPLNCGIQEIMNQTRNDLEIWVMRLDADDMLYNPYVLSKAINMKKQDTLLICGSIIFANSSKKIASKYHLQEKYATVNKLCKCAAYGFPHHATLIALDLLKIIEKEENSFFCTNIGYGEDFDFSLKLFKNCKDDQIVFIEDEFIIKEQSGETITNTISSKKYIKDHLIILLRNSKLSKIFMLKTILWRLLNNCKFCKGVINKMEAPALKFANNTIENYEKIKKMSGWTEE
ncbi:glycosyltransferase [[Clostridium] scindens]|uniref:Glycosyltransferase n=1 Tax=Clostridium scindens (strain JCM 10418 / VPI 12708) TaxID=29347 RepID=A0A844F313_CLOSV|nr:glycosyltransferase [[Clostridium] scindens]MSS40202.1 glycosyltransferase [[Clostridium] scindens]